MLAPTTALPQRSIDYLQELIRLNIDSRDGFREAAANLQSDKGGYLFNLFSQIAREREAQARELQSLVMCSDELPEQTGSLSAAVHRTWMDLRDILGGGEQALLEESERGEDHIKSKYEAAVHDLGACPCTAVLQRHLVAVKASHDEVRDLRDRLRRGERRGV
jgi:uncharacterized protein (TIGR02284 family)